MSLSREKQARLWAALDEAFSLPEEQREQHVLRSFPDDPELARKALAAMEREHLTASRSGPVSAPDPLAASPRAEVGTELVGGVLGDRYRVLERVKSGGMGTVFKGQHVELEHLVAIKVLHSDRGRAEVLQEGRRIASLRHNCIVRVIDVGVHDEHPFLIMEWLEGCDLREWLRCYFDGAGHREVDLDARFREFHRGVVGSKLEPDSYWRFVASSLRDVALALAHAHSLGIAHQDVSPKNVVVTAQGRTALVDFGLATLLKLGAREDGDAPLFGGTAPYMAPEHRRANQDRRLELNDVYGLGATLLHLLLGVPPDRVTLPLRGFRSTQYFAGVARRDRVVPKDLLCIAWKAMQHDPAQRYANATAVAADLEAFLSYRPVSVATPGVPRLAHLWWRRDPYRATLAMAAPVAMLALGTFARERYAYASELQSHRDRVEFAGLYQRLPALYTLSADPRKPRVEGHVEPEQVGELLGDLLDLRPDLDTLRLRRCVWAARAGRLELVREDLEHLARSQPDSGVMSALAPVLRSPDADVRYALVPPDRIQPARTWFDEAALAYLCNAFRQHDPFVRHAEAALGARPEDWVTRELLIFVDAASSRAEPEAGELQWIADELGTADTCTLLHATAFSAANGPLQDHERAIELWSRALRLQPLQYLPYHNRGYSLIRIGRFEQGLRDLDSAFQQRREATRLYQVYAEGLRGLGRFDEAREVLSAALEDFEARSDPGAEDLQGYVDLHEFVLLRRVLYDEQGVGVDEAQVRRSQEYLMRRLDRATEKTQHLHHLQAYRILLHALESHEPADRAMAEIGRVLRSSMVQEFQLAPAVAEAALLLHLASGEHLLGAEDLRFLKALCCKDLAIRARVEQCERLSRIPSTGDLGSPFHEPTVEDK